MKKFEFNYAQQTWDKYREFHTMGGWRNPFVEFANGQLILIGQPAPQARKIYDKYGIQLVTTTDSDVPPLYLNRDDEKPIPKAWVQQGGHQHLAVDWEQRVAVAIGYRYTKSREWSDTVPENISDAYVYWAGPTRLPVARRNITVSSPNKTDTAAIQIKVNEALPALHAIERMRNPPIPHYYRYSKLDLKREWLDLTTEELVAELSKEVYALKSAIHSGFNPLRVVEEVPYLYVKGE